MVQGEYSYVLAYSGCLRHTSHLGSTTVFEMAFSPFGLGTEQRIDLVDRC